MEEVRVCLDIREKGLAKRERKLAREQEKVMEKVKEMDEQQEIIEIEKNKIEKAKMQGSHLDVQRLVNRVQQKSFISDGKSLKEEKTKVIKSSQSMTNMNAYINKCQNCHE